MVKKVSRELDFLLQLNTFCCQYLKFLKLRGESWQFTEKNRALTESVCKVHGNNNEEPKKSALRFTR